MKDLLVSKERYYYKINPYFIKDPPPYMDYHPPLPPFLQESLDPPNSIVWLVKNTNTSYK